MPARRSPLAEPAAQAGRDRRGRADGRVCGAAPGGSVASLVVARPPAESVLLGEPNTEAAFMLSRWDLPKPAIIADVADGAPVVIVDTNNPAELPDGINDADIQAIIDHHKLVGGLETKGPIDIRIEPLACTATLMWKMIGKDLAQMPTEIKGAMLSCILSDTLEFRSPTTTDVDRELATRLADELGLSIPDYAAEMFAASVVE